MIEDLNLIEHNMLTAYRKLNIPIPDTGDIIEFVFCPSEIKAKFKRGKRIKIIDKILNRC